MSRTDEVFKPALSGKNVPILPLDNKWYKLLSGIEPSDKLLSLEEEVKELLKKQGKVNTETKAIKKLKAKLMNDIVGAMDLDDSGERQAEIKKQIEECNNKLDEYQDDILELPRKIREVNYELMIETMELCYETIAENTESIDEIGEWISNIRIELKKNVIRKQEKELKNQQMYSYMHDIFGPDVIDIFDMKYNPETEHRIEIK